MRATLVPVNTAWTSTPSLREALLSNLREKVELSVRELAGSRAFSRVAQDIRVAQTSDALVIELPGAATEGERGRIPRQMTELEGKVIPIVTASGNTIFRKATRLSMMFGKWKTEGNPARRQVKGAIDRAMAGLGDAAVAAKDDVESGAPPRVRDILGVR